MIEERRVNRFPHRVIAAKNETKCYVDATTDQRMRQIELIQRAFSMKSMP